MIGGELDLSQLENHATCSRISSPAVRAGCVENPLHPSALRHALGYIHDPDGTQVGAAVQDESVPTVRTLDHTEASLLHCC